MKTLIKLICIVVLTLSLNSCSTFKITTAGHETVEEITTLNQLRWEMQTDWRYPNRIAGITIITLTILCGSMVIILTNGVFIIDMICGGIGGVKIGTALGI
jgi:maltodextrin utilization protein YvdJ